MEKLSFVIENQLGVAKDNEELKNRGFLFTNCG